MLNKSIIDSSVLFFKAYLTFQSEESLIEGKFLYKSEGKIMLTYGNTMNGLVWGATVVNIERLKQRNNVAEQNHRSVF